MRAKQDAPSRVIFARDTRASGPALVTALVDALKATKTDFTDHGILTTPQLHYLVRCVNTKGTRNEYGTPTEEGYYQKLASAYKKAMEGRTAKEHVLVDCANGVGGPKLRELIKHLPAPKEGAVEVVPINDDTSNPEELNYQVHALDIMLPRSCSDLHVVRCGFCQNPATTASRVTIASVDALRIFGRRC